MATGGPRDSMRENAGDFIGEFSVSQSCEPCMKCNEFKTATIFCQECDEYLCDSCTNPHNMYKPGRHDIVRIKERKSVRVLQAKKNMKTCHEHGKIIVFLTGSS